MSQSNNAQYARVYELLSYRSYESNIEKVPFLEALQQTRAYLVDLYQQRKKGNTDYDYSIPIKTETRFDFVNGNLRPRTIIYMRSVGCEWMKTGGCTMCGFFEATGKGMNPDDVDYLSQVKKAKAAYIKAGSRGVGLYNDGNYLNKKEISLKQQLDLISEISTWPNLESVRIESRINYVDPDFIQELKGRLKPGQELEVSVGVESTNMEIRELCVHKGLKNEDLFKKAEKLNAMGVSLRTLMCVKPPFLTEQEAILDMVKSCRELYQKGIKKIDLEVMTIEDKTLVHALWRHNKFQTPWLWSIVAILQILAQEGIYIYVSPFLYSVDSLETPHNCAKCTERVAKAILEDYNSRQFIKALPEFDCECVSDWEKELLKRHTYQHLPTRVSKIISDLKGEELYVH